MAGIIAEEERCSVVITTGIAERLVGGGVGNCGMSLVVAGIGTTGTRGVNVSGPGCGNCSVVVGTMNVVPGVIITGLTSDLLDSVCCGGGTGMPAPPVEIGPPGVKLGLVPVLTGIGGCLVDVEGASGGETCTGDVTTVTVWEHNPRSGTNGLPKIEVTVAVQPTGMGLTGVLTGVEEVLAPDGVKEFGFGEKENTGG